LIPSKICGTSKNPKTRRKPKEAGSLNSMSKSHLRKDRRLKNKNSRIVVMKETPKDR
jgi:hypothetical protein